MLIPMTSLVYRVVNVVLSGVGLLAVAAVIGIAVYGYIHGRKMVGYLAVKQLPGA
jgi:hypothetical protein